MFEFCIAFMLMRGKMGWWRSAAPIRKRATEFGGGGDAKIGLYLQSRLQPGRVFRIAVEKGLSDGDCFARVIRATGNDVVVSCKPEKSGPGIHRKFVYDPQARALVKLVEYVPMGMRRLRVDEGKAVWTGTDGSKRVEMTHLLDRSWRLRSEPGDIPFVNSKEVVRFGAQQEFVFTQGELQVVERGGKRFSLPATTYDDFQAARPRRVQDGYQRAYTRIEERSGPWQLEGERLWFAKNFYDGEGITGVGGFGYFDGATKRFRMFTPASVLDRSATAMMVEKEEVWLGLAVMGEWGPSGSRLLRFDRETGMERVLELDEFVHRIARWGTSILVATDLGALIWDGDRVRRYFVDVTTDGRLRVVEGIAVQ